MVIFFFFRAGCDFFNSIQFFIFCEISLPTLGSLSSLQPVEWQKKHDSINIYLNFIETYTDQDDSYTENSVNRGKTWNLCQARENAQKKSQPLSLLIGKIRMLVLIGYKQLASIVNLKPVIFMERSRVQIVVFPRILNPQCTRPKSVHLLSPVLSLGLSTPCVYRTWAYYLRFLF